jgi:UDPglucose 6-dehydrogenase
MEAISVIGLGKVGICLSAFCATKGINVYGVDVDTKRTRDIGQAAVNDSEPGLIEILKQCRSKISLSNNIEHAIKYTTLFYIIVPTPSNDNGSFSLKYLKEVCDQLGLALKNKKEYFLVVIGSTVLPGSVRLGLIPILEKTSGKKSGVDFGVCYNPLFISLGNIINNFSKPDFILIGCTDIKAGKMLQSLYERLDIKAPIKSMSLENAELAKLAVNTYVTAKITYANMLANLCEAIPGGDIDVVTDTIGADKRIGPYFLKGGLGYGGPCFPRDNNALQFLSDQLGKNEDIPAIIHKNNENRIAYLLSKIPMELSYNNIVSVLGITYKPGTTSTENSQGAKIVEALALRFSKVNIYDPSMQELPYLLGLLPNIKFCSSLRESISRSKLIIIAGNDILLKVDDIVDPEVFIIDIWRLLYLPAQYVNYIAIGRAREDEALMKQMDKIINSL